MASSMKDYPTILSALTEIPFPVGKRLLMDFLQGKTTNESVQRNKLHNLPSFGAFAYLDSELEGMINALIHEQYLTYDRLNKATFYKVLQLTAKGKKALENKQISVSEKQQTSQYTYAKTTITEQDKERFNAFGSFLSAYNDEQKKAIIAQTPTILCIAGAGSGKTTVLTKRIEFLLRYQSIPAHNILAITFTRKAREEMMKRLAHLNQQLAIETFNSFCEKCLQKHEDLIYCKSCRVISYREKIKLVLKALELQKISLSQALDKYFTFAQKRSKTDEQLMTIFVNDCFFLREYLRAQNKSKEGLLNAEGENKERATLVFRVVTYIDEAMYELGLRDYPDQIMDALSFFKKHPEYIPQYDYILIDEYQDINQAQQELVTLLNPKHLFCVGDPRQAIFGWRGAETKHILAFTEKYKDAEVILLTKNYRSTHYIVDVMNQAIRNMHLPDLEPSVYGKKDMRLLSFETESAEFEFIIQCIQSSTVPRKEIFVLARTNKQLNELSQLMTVRAVPHVTRSDERRIQEEAGENQVTLATIHAIKGMEAQLVFIMGCTKQNFPCKAAEHPLLEMIKVDAYNKEEEERRLFYVALSRAKASLYLTYTGRNLTSFMDTQMHELFGTTHSAQHSLSPHSGTTGFKESVKGAAILNRLKEWRQEISRAHHVQPYMVLHDKTLLALIEERPQTKQDLERISGLGPVKIMRYGDDLLNMLQ